MWYYRTILPYSKIFETLEETFAATNFTTKSIHEWTKRPSAIGWLARELADVRLRTYSYILHTYSYILHIYDARIC